MKRTFTFIFIAVAGAAAAVTYKRPLERVASMDPLRSSAIYDSTAISLAYESLLEVDYFARPYKLRANLCDLPEVSSNRLEYVFTIRPGAAFHPDKCFPGGKGRPVTSADVVYSLNRLADKKNASSGMWTMASVKKVEALDDRRVKITLKAPQHVFPWLMSMTYTGVVPREAVEMYGTHFGGVAVGSGPYRLAEWWCNHRMRFERAPDWHGWKEIKTKPYDEIEYLVIDDASTMWLMFLSKEVDMLRGIASDNWDAVIGPDGDLVPELRERGVRLYSHVSMEVGYFGVNMKDPVLGPNKKLRQALNCAFDFDTWNRFCNNRLLPSTGPVPPGVDGRLETPFAYSYNLEKAKRLIEEAGYPGGIDPKTGRRLVISVSAGRANQEVREEIELVQSFYGKIGIKLEPRYMTWDAFLQAVNEGRTTMFMMGWVGDYPDAENFLQLFHTKNCSPGANHSCYSNPEFDALYDKAMATNDPAERLDYWRKAQEILREDCPWVFLSHTKRHALAWGHVGNYIPTDFPYGMEKHYYVREGAKDKPEARQ
ncbi:MAG: hypothetical protein IKL96_06355 [Kiritimatiellae bacterium]|nr:hypothetical protein [Kiritimatiellia bacterium]